MHAFRFRAIQAVAVLALVFLTCVVYEPGLTGPFIFDDAPNITENSAVKITDLNYDKLINAAFSVPAGPLYRPVSFVSFALNYYFFELEPFYFKATNLLIHLGVGAVIFWSTYLLYMMAFNQGAISDSLRRKVFWVALLVAALFLVHPFNVSSVLYVVQRMNSLAALFMFMSLSFYLLGRRQMLLRSDTKAYAPVVFFWGVSAFVFFPLAVLSKENALLLPFLILVMEETLLKWNTNSPAFRRVLALLRVLLWVGVGVVLLALIVGWERVISGYVHRDFTLIERLLTEPQILFRYISLILVPINRGMTFYHDDIATSSSIFEGEAFIYVLFWVLLLSAALLLRRRSKWFSFAVLWFLVGHSMESTIIALELAHEHRNYIPMYGVLVAIGATPLGTSSSKTSSLLYGVLAIAVILVVSASTFIRTTAWGEFGALVERQYRLNPASPRANYSIASFVYTQAILSQDEKVRKTLYNESVLFFDNVHKLDNTDFSGMLAISSLSDQMGYIAGNRRLEMAAEIAGRVPLGQKDMAHVQDFLHCQLNKFCSAKVSLVGRLIENVLANPSLPQGFEVTLKADFGVLLSMHGKHAKAGEYFADVVGLEPDWWIYRIAAIRTLMWGGNLEKANTMLRAINAEDVPESLKGVFSELDSKLVEMGKISDAELESIGPIEVEQIFDVRPAGGGVELRND